MLNSKGIHLYTVLRRGRSRTCLDLKLNFCKENLYVVLTVKDIKRRKRPLDTPKRMIERRRERERGR